MSAADEKPEPSYEHSFRPLENQVNDLGMMRLIIAVEHIAGYLGAINQKLDKLTPK